MQRQPPNKPRAWFSLFVSPKTVTVKCVRLNGTEHQTVCWKRSASPRLKRSLQYLCFFSTPCFSTHICSAAPKRHVFVMESFILQIKSSEQWQLDKCCQVSWPADDSKTEPRTGRKYSEATKGEKEKKEFGQGRRLIKSQLFNQSDETASQRME